ncbi:recombinase family protein [Salmonella enterica]|nr:recombinase family protein [Salmonella enterica]EKK6596324.1 recombinase family protein [Salmonella enterica]
MKVIAYKRVSTKGQERSGLGMEAQQAYIDTAIKANGWELIATFEDQGVSGTIHPQARPAMADALQMAAETGASLLAAKVDRFSRDVEHMAWLAKAVPVKVATMPHADGFQLHLFAALAQQEREFIASRTRDALASLQARAEAGEPEAIARITRRNKAIKHALATKPHKAAQVVNGEAADQYALQVRGAILEARADGYTTLHAIAGYLNYVKKLKTRRGAKWSAMAVSRAIARIERLTAQNPA